MEQKKKIKIIIIVLACLLGLSLLALGGTVIYNKIANNTPATVTVPDNLIGEENSESQKKPAENSSQSETTPLTDGESVSSQTDAAGNSSKNGNPTADKPIAVKLELYEGRPGANQRFEVKNMFPGDTETKYFCVKAHHDADLELFFRTKITGQTKNLSDVLHIKVTHLETGKVLCDAPFAEIDGKEFSELLKKNAAGETTAYYQIDVSLDTSVGNEYQAAELKADFAWYVKDEGGLTPPPTGDTTNLILWITLAASSLLLLVLLWKRRKEARHE